MCRSQQLFTPRYIPSLIPFSRSFSEVPADILLCCIPFRTRAFEIDVKSFKEESDQLEPGLSLESQVLPSSPHLATNKPHFVHHKEEKMSSAFSSDYVRAAFLGQSGQRRNAGQQLSCYQPQPTRFRGCQAMGYKK